MARTGRLAGKVLPARSRRAGRAAGQRPRREERPGPAQDKLDAVWLAKLTEKGLLRPSFVPPAPIRQLRDYARPADLPTVFTTRWCGYCIRLKSQLSEAGIGFQESILKTMPMALQSSLRSTTAISPYRQFSSGDGSALTNPSAAQVGSRLA